MLNKIFKAIGNIYCGPATTVKNLSKRSELHDYNLIITDLCLMPPRQILLYSYTNFINSPGTNIQCPVLPCEWVLKQISSSLPNSLAFHLAVRVIYHQASLS